MRDYNFYSALADDAIRSLDLDRSPRGLYEPIRYTLDGGGKRMRPVLTLAAADAVGAEPEDVVSQAIGVEMFHNFTLLHDDVMDRADMRRGRPTVHVRWNEQTAILSGDAMLTLATQLVSRCKPEVLPAVLDLFNRTAMEIYEGQQLDMDFERRLDVTEDEYIEMIRLKTSVLLGCAARMGVVAAQGPDDVADALYDYGVKMGLAFQLRDDVLDTYGDPIVFGKRVGGDIINDKKTWLLITALRDDKTGTLEGIITSGYPQDEDKVTAVRKIYDDLDVRTRCEALIERYTREAIDIIDRSAITAAARDFFITLANTANKRTH